MYIFKIWWLNESFIPTPAWTGVWVRFLSLIGLLRFCLVKQMHFLHRCGLSVMLQRLSDARLFEQIPRFRCNHCLLIFTASQFWFEEKVFGSQTAQKNTEDNAHANNSQKTHDKQTIRKNIPFAMWKGNGKAIWPDDFAYFEQIVNELRKQWGNNLK